MKIQLTSNNIERQHFSGSAFDMQQLSAPLKKLGIEIFSRVRIWEDQSISLLTTHPSFSILFIEEKFYEFAFAGKLEEYSDGIVLLNDTGVFCPKLEIIKNAFVEHCHLKLDLAIIEKHELYVDFFWFGTPCYVVNTANFYMNKIAYLKEYIASFQENGATLLLESNDNKLIYPTSGADKTFLTSPDFHKLIQCPQINRYAFTKKERSCLALLRKGMSPKEISSLLKKSPRTIEKHLLSIRKKTGKKSLLRLVASFNDCFPENYMRENERNEKR